MVLAFYYEYAVFIGDQRKGTARAKADTCLISMHAFDESVTFNICDNTVQALKPNKIPLDVQSIDSITIYSKALNEKKLLTNMQVTQLAEDWNKSKPRGYSDSPFDSAFYEFPAYQYKLIVFSKGKQRPFYGYNGVILDSSNWKYEMEKTDYLNYFHSYWKK
ncbi:MAG TPA: hypothetical protein VFZ47_00765 [Chitinophagaceae bacterium]